MNQINTVINAMSELSVATSADISDETGISIKKCSAYLHKLMKLGVVRKTGTTIKEPNMGIRKYDCYELCSNGTITIKNNTLWSEDEDNLVRNGLHPQGRSKGAYYQRRVALGITKYRSWHHRSLNEIDTNPSR